MKQLLDSPYFNFFQIRIIWKDNRITRYYPIKGKFKAIIAHPNVLGEEMSVDAMLELINKPTMQLQNIATTHGFIITYKETN